ncbi:MAG: APC family permease [Chloroflexi bacterium]|nr:APC family permease [Chloroflexota bacterium]
MQELKHRKPGDKIIRRPREAARRLRRVLGVGALYSAGYGNVGSSIYYALGIVAVVAVGATPIALLAAGILFVFTALTYAEGSTMFPEAGGSASFARRGFNEHVGFAAGWALLLSYIVTISLSAYTVSPYLGYFLPPLKDDPVLGIIVSIGIILFLMLINIIGVKETSFVNIGAAVLDVATQASLVIIGLVLLISPGIVAFTFEQLKENIFGAGNWPSTGNLIYGIALAALAYTGVETMSQMAEETRRPQIRVPRAMILMIVTVLVMFSGISIVALSAMTPQELANEWARDPVAGIAYNLPFEWMKMIFKPLVGVLAATILLIATNAGLMGISRLAFSMGTNKQLPAAFHRLHSRFRTPYIAIIVFTIIAIAIVLPGLFTDDAVSIFSNLGGLYTFGSLLSFAVAHASILALRVKQPKLERPFKLGWNIRIKGRELPITAIIGLVATVAIWFVIVNTQPYSRWLGLGWMALGLGLYILFKWRGGVSSDKNGKPPE